MIEKPKSKIITVSLRLSDIRDDPDFFSIPGEIEDPNLIREYVLKKYRSDFGIIEGFIENERLILQWYPSRVDETAEALHQEAVALAKAKQYEKAITKWEKAILLNNEDVDYLYKLGLVYFEMKRFRDSIQQLEKTVRICPIYYRAYLIMGIDWIKLRKFDKAENSVLESNRLNKSNVLSYLNLGVIYSIQKRFNEAIKMFNSTIQLSPKESRAYLGLARIYTMLGDVEAANSYFRKVIELSPGTRIAEYAKKSLRFTKLPETKVQTIDDRGESLAKGIGSYLSGDYSLASGYYKKYLNNHPSDDYAWYLLGEVNLRIGALAKSADCFKRAARLNSKRALYYKALGLALHYLGKSRETTQVLKKAIDMGKNDALCLTVQGINLMRQRKLDEAINNFKLAIKRNPNSPLAIYNLALAFIQIEEKKQAVELLKKIVSFEYLVPLKDQAKRLLQDLEYPR